MQRRRVAAVAMLVATVTSLGALTRTGAQSDPASRAIAYLQGKQLADGSVPPPSPFTGYSPTELLVIAAAADGYDPNALTHGGASAVHYLAANAAAASSNIADAGLLTQAAVAAHADPTAFGGVNLVHILTSSLQSNGAYGTPAPTYQQAYSILGLRAAGASVPAPAYAYLRGLQDTDGGWNYTDHANDSSGSDTNDTAVALMALATDGSTASATATTAALAWLHTQQSTDGGFGYVLAYGSDPDSTGLVMQALVATAQPLTAWTSAQSNPVTWLRAAQDATGGFGFGAPPDAYTTAQAIGGLLSTALPGTSLYAPGTSPCSADTAATAAIHYVARNLGADGAVPSYGAPGDDAVSTAYLVTGAADLGVAQASLTSGGATAIHYLSTAAPANTGDAGRLGAISMGLIAGGIDPATLGSNNPLPLLAATYDPVGGAYGNGQTATQALAILGLSAAHQSVPAAATSYLHHLEEPDGGWNYTAAATGTPSDTNSTAMAVMALDATGDHEADAAALTWLHGQETGGAFGYQLAWGADDDSTALVIQAIVSTGDNPAAAPWAQAGVTPVMALAGSQNADGGAGYPGIPAATPPSDVFTTAQLLNGMVRAPFSSVNVGLSTCPAAPVSPNPPPATPAAPTAVVTPSPSAVAHTTHRGASDNLPPTSAAAESSPTPTAQPTPTPEPSTSPTSVVQATAATPPPALGATPAATPRGGDAAWFWYVAALAAGVIGAGATTAVVLLRRAG